MLSGQDNRPVTLVKCTKSAHRDRGTGTIYDSDALTCSLRYANQQNSSRDHSERLAWSCDFPCFQ